MPTAPHDPLIENDIYLGLLTDPPGEWSISRYGPNGLYLVVLKGNPSFHRRAFNLFESFGGERTSPLVLREIAADVCAISITEDRILRALELWLYGRLVKTKGDILPVLDSEGDETDVVVVNQRALEAEAAALARRFYDEVLHATPLPCNPEPANAGPEMPEARLVMGPQFARWNPTDTDSS